MAGNPPVAPVVPPAGPPVPGAPGGVPPAGAPAAAGAAPPAGAPAVAPGGVPAAGGAAVAAGAAGVVGAPWVLPPLGPALAGGGAAPGQGAPAAAPAVPAAAPPFGPIPAAAGGAAMAGNNPALRGLTASNLRNGMAGGLAPMARQSSILPHHYWVQLATTPAAPGAAPTITVGDVADALVKSSWAWIIATTLAGFDAIPDGPTLLAAANADIVARRAALMLGGTRAGAIFCWGIATPDLLPNEVSPEIVYQIDMGTGNTRLTAPATAAPFATVLGKMAYLAQNMGLLTAGEGAVVMDCCMMGAAAVPLAGASLVKCGHHYLTSTPARGNAVYSQVKEIGQSEAAWAVMGDAQGSMGLVFHKAMHPVSAGLLIEIAMNSTTPTKLETVNLGSAAVGLPANPPLVATAKTYIELMAQSAPVMSSNGHNIGVPGLAAALAEVQAIPFGQDRIAAAAIALPAPITRARTVVSYAFGYYMDCMENSGRPKGTLEAAYSLLNASGQCPMSYAAGVAQANSDRRYAKAQEAQGRHQTITMSDA